ncbi:MAG: DUF2927 domain-containing protein [Reyranella sp.]|uniref:DUF2927 domain-containing protein n=1 Tax=Reyranella sp. TaxID=1929291 RepID=UPI001ACCB810|nr:DUF2927 domain-containing protein [Reyranella sp.]MBN9089839.1 DUF2927 domain-containing protein [Reyranella sp.]
MMRFLACLLLAAGLLPAPVGAQSRDMLADAARAFDESALRLGDDDARPIGVRKWLEPIKLGFDNPSTHPDLVRITREAVRTIAVEAGVPVVDLSASSGANFVVYFDENGVNGKAGYCFANSWWKSWAINRGELRINPTRMRDIDRCTVHEAMHAFGFNSHPHAADSILSYTHGRRALSPLDLHLIHTLYDPRLTLGMKPAPASQLACRMLGERLGAAAAAIEAVCRDRKGPTPAL